MNTCRNSGNDSTEKHGNAASPWRSLATVPWGRRDMAGVAVHRDQMWVLGGWFMGTDNRHQLYNDVWRSADGLSWELITPRAPWRARCYHSAVSFRDKLWLIGGYVVEPPTNVLGDVWSSPDGETWDLACARPPWADREHAGCVVLGDHLYFMGGVTYGPPFHCFTDVWRTIDGADWELVTPRAAWEDRRGFVALVMGDRIWLMGGADSQGNLYNDVWTSVDGRIWELVTREAAWSPRVTMGGVVAGGRLWIIGGNLNPQGVSGSEDVWSSADGLHWEPHSPGWPPRAGCLAMALGQPGREDIFVLGGFDQPADALQFSDAAWQGHLTQPSTHPEPSLPAMPSPVPRVHDVSRLKTGLWTQPDSGSVFASQMSEEAQMGCLIFNHVVQEIFDRYALPGQRVLDMGCGTGITSLHLARRGCQVVACDASASMLSELRRGKGYLPIEIRQGDAFQLPLEEAGFDTVVSRMFLNHFPDWYLVLARWAAALKPGGHAVYTFASAEHYNLATDQVGPVDPEGFVFTPEAEGGKFLAHVDRRTLKMIAQSVGLELVEVVPVGLFQDNAIICAALGAGDFNAFKERLNRFLEHEPVREFLMWMERTVVSRLPAWATYTNVTVLRKT